MGVNMNPKEIRYQSIGEKTPIFVWYFQEKLN